MSTSKTTIPIRVPDDIINEVKDLIAKRKAGEPEPQPEKKRRAPGGGRPKGSKNRPICSLQALPSVPVKYEDEFTIVKVDVTQSHYFRVKGDYVSNDIVAVCTSEGVEVCAVRRLNEDSFNEPVPHAPEPLVIMCPIPKTIGVETKTYGYSEPLIDQPRSLFEDYANQTILERTNKKLEFQRSIRGYELLQGGEPELNCFNFYNKENQCREKCVRTDLFAKKWDIPWYTCENVEEWCIKNDVHHGEPTHDRSCDECSKSPPPELSVPGDKYNESDYENEMSEMYANGYRSDD